MAESEGASKTEEATPRKLDDARKKGDVPKSQDVAPFAGLAAAIAVVATLGGSMSQNLGVALAEFIAHAGDFDLANGGAVALMTRCVWLAAPPVGAVMLAAGLAGAAGNLVQHGLLWSPEKLKPDLNKLSPLAGFKRLFGPDALIQFAKTFIKLLAVGAVVWFVVRSKLAGLQTLPGLDVAAVLPLTMDLILGVSIVVLLLLGTVAGADFFWQRIRFAQQMRMTKEEVKDDHKQSDGDPHVKAKLKQQRHERSKRRMMQNLPQATVVVMNPTHYAVALRYEPGETAAPVCLAKGTDALALRIRGMCEDLGIPVVEDPPLARALYAAVDVDETIPREHFDAVAKVIGFILSGRQRPSASPLRP